jgi:adenylate cyclase
MQPCPNCGLDNADDAERCVRCSAAFASACPACGQVVPPGSRYCNRCGAPLSLPDGSAPNLPDRERRQPVPSTSAGERRQLATILFLDIANFTATADALDAEDVYLFIDEAMGLLADVVYKYEGIVDKYTGDGLMALFGVPVAHEDDPERAVRAALEMHAALEPLRARLKTRYHIDLRARVGVNTGVVVAGSVGSGTHEEYTVIGDAVNLANRLQSVAEPGSVVVSLSTYRGTWPFFRYRALSPMRVKGKPHPVSAFQALGLRARTGRGRGLPGVQVPMVGRKDALIRLRNTLAEVVQHRRTKVAPVPGLSHWLPT